MLSALDDTFRTVFPVVKEWFRPDCPPPPEALSKHLVGAAGSAFIRFFARVWLRQCPYEACIEPRLPGLSDDIVKACKPCVNMLLRIVRSLAMSVGIDVRLTGYEACPTVYHMIAMVLVADAAVDCGPAASRAAKLRAFQEHVTANFPLETDALIALRHVVDSEARLLECGDEEVLELRCRSCFYTCAVPALVLLHEAPLVGAQKLAGFDSFEHLARALCVAGLVWGLVDDIKDYGEDRLAGTRTPAQVCAASCMRAAIAALEALGDISPRAMSAVACWTSLNLYDAQQIWLREGIEMQHILHPYEAMIAPPLMMNGHHMVPDPGTMCKEVFDDN